LEAHGGLLGDGLDAEAGGVGVGADNGDRVARTPLAADCEGDDGGAVAGQVVTATRLEGGSPRVALADGLEAGLFEALDGGVNSMVG
jgi:hypothetical protein